MVKKLLKLQEKILNHTSLSEKTKQAIIVLFRHLIKKAEAISKPEESCIENFNIWNREMKRTLRQKAKKGFIKLSEKIATDKSLSPKTPQVAIALFSHLNQLKVCCKTQAQLAHIAKVSIKTVGNALKELELAGYITSEKTSFFHKKRNQWLNGIKVYHCHVPVVGFIFVPRRILGKIQRGKFEGTKVMVYLYLCYRMNNGRAYPSLSMIEKDTGVSVKTICEAKKLMEEEGLIYVQHCIKENNSYSHNSYFPLQEVKLDVAQGKIPVSCVDISPTGNSFHGAPSCVSVPCRSIQVVQIDICRREQTQCLVLAFSLPVYFLSISKLEGQHSMRTRHGGTVIFTELY
jgi:DNA-binding transcriptional regulator YhcF (GntR family)